MRPIFTVIGLVSALLTAHAHASSGQCGFIKDPDLQARCRAESGGGSAQCIEQAVRTARTQHQQVGIRLKVIGFDDPTANDWLVVNQFSVSDGQHNRRPDLVVFLNGLPLGLIELKNSGTDVGVAIRQLLSNQDKLQVVRALQAVVVDEEGDADDGDRKRAGMRHGSGRHFASGLTRMFRKWTSSP
jgi:hypothetical protein